jgi:hypothetical protein
VDDIWVSVWHYRPVCEDPCSDINHAVVDAYEFVESLLVQGRVLKKKWGKWHRAYRAGENPVR